MITLDSIWTPVAKYLAALPDRYVQREAYARYKAAREANVDALIALAPSIKSLLTPRAASSAVAVADAVPRHAIPRVDSLRHGRRRTRRSAAERCARSRAARPTPPPP